MNKKYHAGWDYFSACREKLGMNPPNCKVCGEKTRAERNIVGPTSSIGAMMREQTLHDSFYCYNVGKPWHTQVRLLKEEMEKTHSKAIRDLYQHEIKEILDSREPTLPDVKES